MKNNITVIITTRNRPEQIKDCLVSIVKSSFQDYRILVADQSDDEKTVQAIHSFASKNIDVVRMKQKGKSKGLNLLIKKAQTEIIAFTDDDCIIKKDWLQKIYDTYQKQPQLAGVFGNTYPYQPEKHLQRNCPATFEVEEFKIHNFENLHYYHVGLGNNMSLRKSVLEKIGYFQEWLGPGAVGQNGEESEIIFRILKNKLTLATNPEMIVFHNRWLNYTQQRLLETRYTHGFITFLSYYLFTDDREHAWSFIKIKAKERIFPALRTCRNVTKQLLKEYYFLFLEVIALFKGMLIGLLARTIKK